MSEMKQEAFDLLVELLANECEVHFSNDGIGYEITINGTEVRMDGRSLEETISFAFEIWNGTIRINKEA